MDVITRAFLDFKEALGKMVRPIVGSVEVEDIVHEAYIRSYEASKNKNISSPKAFLASTARNLALNHINRSAVKLNVQLDIEDSPHFQSQEPGVEEQVDSQNRFFQFCHAVESLPVQCRRVFILRQVYGLSHKKIARTMGVSEKTVEYHISNGLFKCRQYLKLLDSETTAGALKMLAAKDK